jgi:glutamyl-tRNA reductase
LKNSLRITVFYKEAKKMGYSIILFEYLPRDTNRNGERRDAGPISFYKPDVNEIRKKYISLNEHMADVVCTVKCNAILITGIFSRECTPRLAQRLLRIAWRRSTPGNEIPPNFRCYENEDAIMRIVETSIGLHSVVIGDTQVYSQIISPFVNTPVAETKKFLANIAKICEKTRAQAEKNTDLYKGGCSVERIGMDFLASYLNESGRSRIGVLGTGQSANLVSKIAKEQQMEVFVYGRNKEGLKEIISKYQAAEWSVRDDEIDAVVVCLPNDDDARKFVENTVQSIKWSPGNRIVLDISPEPFNIGHLIGDCRIIDWPIIQERANAVSKARANEKSKVLNICKTVRIEMDHLLRSAPTEMRKVRYFCVSK